MGQKVHPIGFRVGVIRDWDSRWFLDKGYADAVYEDYRIRRFVKAYSSSRNAAISRVEIDRPGGKLRVTIHTARPGIVIGKKGEDVEVLRKDLERLVGKPVHLNIQEIHHPDIDAQLVAESIAQQIEKRIAYKRAMRQAIMRAMKLGVKGIRVMCSGRLAGAEMARREHQRDGKIPLHTLRADIDYGFAEGKTTYGNIGVKVWIYKGDVLPGGTRPTETEIVPARVAGYAERRERAAGGASGRRSSRTGTRGRGRRTEGG
ncbi:MAG: 30S ribosomal protein S3 [Chthonomonadales bacterium]